MAFDSGANQEQYDVEACDAKLVTSASLRVGFPVTLPDAFWLAIEQFNGREYYACHETLERLWIPERGDVREIYQGVLQIAVGCYHLTVRRNVSGAMTLLERGARRLEERLFGEAASALDQFGASSETGLYGIDWRGLIVMTDALRHHLEEGDTESSEHLEHILLPRISIAR